ncbi:HEAT repeat domain-containing protein [Starkeya sp. ORNL1]|uniref:HEAT repeat domain-containing protein n=1 Tax=Starkeya sp. ORNL1 TaxID=2709380 RepID=UPI001463FEFE|nr:HEAT repeat domain-containing protein [Starkeya sp. ORNL1]QJP13254.1 HEAT repeat domain-containing protein [Starkeya sp. ORNL1]
MPLIRKNTVSASPEAPFDLEAARSALGHGNVEERWRAARALLAMPGGVTIAGAALAGESDARVREVIFTGLARSPTVEGAEILLALLRSDDVGLRTGSLDAMRTMPDLVAARLPALLADADPDVRLLSCELVRGLPAGEATRLMCELLEREDQPNVCAAAVDVLAEIGEPQAQPVLELCAERFAGSPFLAFAIEIAVKRLRKPSNANRD